MAAFKNIYLHTHKRKENVSLHSSKETPNADQIEKSFVEIGNGRLKYSNHISSSVDASEVHDA